MTRKAIETRILQAAGEEFAAHGVGGARVARIAAAANANKERLYHYYGGKEALFRAVQEDAMRQIVAAEPFAPEDLGAYVSAMADFHRRHPTLVRLLLAEARHHSEGSLLLEPERTAHYASRVEALRKAQSSGTIRSDLDPRIILYAVLALVITAEALPQLTELILASDPAAKPLDRRELHDGLQELLDVVLSPPCE